jgi:hypothetical protein
MDHLEKRVNGIALVFFTMWINGPANPQGPEISDRLFKSKQECAEFVNTIAQGDVVNDNYEFTFASMDGLVFKGGCYSPEEFAEKFYIVDPV